jgi:formylglycine-generating enzyme required for sulfatase activity
MRRLPGAKIGALLLALACLVPRPREAVAQGPAGRRPSQAARIDPSSGLDFVLLAGGTFHYGCEPVDVDCSDDERPGRSVTIGAFWMGRTEVTVEAYARCVSDGACTPASSGGACNWGAPDRGRHPINCVDWTQASTFCQHLGGALPTAEEWEWSAKGGEAHVYPWGDDPPTDRRANFADVQYKRKYPRAFDTPGDDGWIETAPVGSFPAGASKQGLLDLVGNVIEWTASEYDPGHMEARGGGWSTDTVSRRLRASYRTARDRSFWHATYGFRCKLPATP